jgi:hypothetical protein
MAGLRVLLLLGRRQHGLSGLIVLAVGARKAHAEVSRMELGAKTTQSSARRTGALLPWVDIGKKDRVVSFVV